MATTFPLRTAAAARSSASGLGSSGLISTRSVAISALTLADRGRDIDGHLIAAERCAQLNALHHRPDPLDHLARDSDAFLPRAVRVVCAPHPFYELIRNRHPQFVDHELGVA